MSEQNKVAMRRFYDDVVNKGNVDLIDDLLTEDFREYEQLPPGLEPTREGVKQLFRTFREAFPDLRFEVEDLLADDDKVVARITIRGTHEGEFMGIPATGKKVEFGGIDIVQFRDGKAVAHWGVSDTAGMLEQLGAIPAQAGAPA
ncbi:MAG: ester cyclase [Gaiellaceae bacterium]